MSKYIDITVGLRNDMPVWPGSGGIKISQYMGISSGDQANVSNINMDVHVGTHVDAPYHFLPGGRTVDNLSLDILVGTAYVIEVTGDSVTPQDLESAALPEHTERLLIKTTNSKLWSRKNNQFNNDYVALTSEAAQWVVDNEIRLVGIDYMSIQRYTDDSETHEILLKHEVVVIEGLDLTEAEVGKYELICLPLKIIGIDGAPARAVLKKPGKAELK